MSTIEDVCSQLKHTGKLDRKRDIHPFSGQKVIRLTHISLHVHNYTVVCMYVCMIQGLTLAMCPLARTHFLGGRASSGHNNGGPVDFFFFFFFFKDYHSYFKNVTRVAPE